MNLYIPNPKTNIQLAPKPLAVGGEGELYTIISPNTFVNLVAKVLLPNKRNLDKRRKIEYLIANAPDNQANAHADVIWAKFVLENEQGEFVGYLMDKAEGEKLELLCTNKIPVPFQQKWGRFSLDLPESRLLRLKICYNLCVAVEKMHRKGYVLVDLKPENVMIQPDGRVSVIDTDSVQVVENQKLLYPANVSTPEYTPAENYHIAHTPIDKRIISKTWDEFSIAVIQYRILFGIHPFTATSAGRYEHCTDLQQKIQCGLFVHSPNHQAFISKMPAPHAAYTSCPTALKDYFCASLAANPAERLPLQSWIPMLQKVITTLANVNVVKPMPVVHKPVTPITTPPVAIAPKPVVTPKPTVNAPVVQPKQYILGMLILAFGVILLFLGLLSQHFNYVGLNNITEPVESVNIPTESVSTEEIPVVSSLPENDIPSEKSTDWWNSLDEKWRSIFIENLQSPYLAGTPEFISDLKRIKRLDCTGVGIKNLEPIRTFSELEVLFCGNNQINNLEPLSRLTNLRYLDCGYNKINSLNPIKNLNSLYEVFCKGNQLQEADKYGFKKNTIIIMFVEDEWED